MTSTPDRWPNRRRLVAAFMAGGFGLFFLFVGLNRPTIANMRTIDLLHAAHRSPEFRKEWSRFDEVTDEIDPHLYEQIDFAERQNSA